MRKEENRHKRYCLLFTLKCHLTSVICNLLSIFFTFHPIPYTLYRLYAATKDNKTPEPSKAARCLLGVCSPETLPSPP
jgi:hypothetical protein